MNDQSPVSQLISGSPFVCDLVWPVRPQYQNTYASLSRFKSIGYDMVSVTLAGDQHNASEALKMTAKHRSEVSRHSDDFVLFRDMSSIEEARRDDKLAIMFHFEGTRCFERNLDLVEAFFELGVRFNLLAFNQNNSAGGGSTEKTDPGLTAFGKRLVKEMERVGMLLDLSHTGRKTTMEAMELYEGPAFFSHVCVDAVAPQPRNITDEQINMCAERKGVVGLSGASMYLGGNVADASTMFRHLDYIVQLVGPDVPALGFDVIFDCELDLSRDCAAPLTTYRVAKENTDGISTNRRIPCRSSTRSADERLAA